MEVFLRRYCMAGMFAMERGGTVSHLHLQVRLSVAIPLPCMLASYDVVTTVVYVSRVCYG